MTSAFRDYEFKNKIDDALKTVRTILDTTKHPQRPADSAHQYEDKYTLVEQAHQAAIEACMNGLAVLGLEGSAVEGGVAWAAANKAVSVRLAADERCVFVRKAERKVESKTQHVTEIETASSAAKVTHKTVTTVTEWFWTYEVEYKLVLFCGANPDQRAVLLGRSGSAEIVTTSEKSPRPAAREAPALDLNLTWLFKHLAGFAIDRAAKSCHTPRRNADVDAALGFFSSLAAWCGSLDAYFRGHVFPAQKLDAKIDVGAANASGVFVPIVPLMLPAANDGERSTLLPADDRAAFVAEQRRSLDAKLAGLGKTFPDDKQLVTVAEANLLCAAQHLRDIAQRHADCVAYVEHMLEQQLIAAIGKQVTPSEFADYMQYHARRLFAADFAPKPFVYAIRRPEHCPEGLLTIEANVGDGAVEQPIQTIVSCQAAAKPMFFALGAATRAAFLGERYLHGAIMHQFSHQIDASIRLTARARQFSSFVLMVGKIASADTFEPTHAVIVQNKDDLLVPLTLEQIPSAKAFRDAIESLSPEMQRFAKAFRAMQLESTLFGVCVVEIKPQLERLLNLQPDALTKEIRLTQDLMELFIEYQIPSDLLSFDGKEHLDAPQRVAEVKRHVQELRDMINESKARELEEEKQKAAFAKAERLRNMPMPSPQPVHSAPAPRMMMARGGGGPGGPPQLQMMSAMASGPAPVPSAAPPSAPMAPPVVNQPPPPPPEAVADARAPEPEQAEKEAGIVEGEGDVEEGLIDYTQVPAALDAKFDKLDEDGAVRPTTIKPGNSWRKKFQKALLAKPSETTLNKDGLRTEKNKALDLLDALSRSGALPLGNCQLHVVILSTHCFDKTLLHTVTHDNVNPIEKVERTQLIIASEVHQRKPIELIKESQLDRVKEFNANLFD